MSQISLKAARVNKGLTLTEVGEAVNLSAYTLSKYERGEAMPRWDVFVRLCRLYELPLDAIFLPEG